MKALRFRHAAEGILNKNDSFQSENVKSRQLADGVI
jgi:hypothetical protein